MRKNALVAALLGFTATLGVSLADEPAVTAPVAAVAAKDSAPAPVRRAATRAPHWAYQPVRHVETPAVANRAWVRTPVDAFVLAKLEAEKLAPSAPADRATFIRRATLDVWGVIPSPDDVQAFVKDRSPNAYEKLVDRLLASPQYGVRQARRWLDLARYADSTGFEGDQTRPNMYRYRDYVVDSFNADKPFDRFVQEQIAGDEIAADDQQALIATGFLAGYPDNRNSRDLIQRKYQIATDITDTVGEVFLGQTVQCARCHDHKFDPVSQKEYFQLQAFFANVAEVTTIPVQDVGPIEQEYRAAQAKYEAATKELRAQQEALLEPVRAETVKYQKERYLVDSQSSLFKPESDWTAFDRWINHRWENVTRGGLYELDRYLRETAQLTLEETGKEDAEKLATLAELRRLDGELDKLNNLRPRQGSDTITAMTELGHSDAPPTYVFFGGDHDRPLEEVQPGFPAAFAAGAVPEIAPTATSSGRRTALAAWIASGDNPLTARVFVNRVWAQYFGNGIVTTVSNFGYAGTEPTHPELLDYLAERFVAGGWSVKALHREILLSSVYRQSSAHRGDAFAADPENKLLATFPRRRLDAEQIRDSLLAASGLLDESLGGPSVFPPVPGNLNAGNRWQTSKNEQDFYRRSLYIFTRRSVAYPLLEAFDMASAQQVHSARDVTTTALQALTLYNSDIAFESSKALAGRVIREAGSDDSARLDRLYEILLARTPDKTERGTLLAFLDEHENVLKTQSISDGKFAVNVPTGVEPAQAGDPLRAAAFVDLVHTVANSNDFAYRF
jgi:uncharacterized protein DUF1553/uncharacterized protein DUF1549